MFQFFSKKRFLVDYLENFIDIHNHILPGIDDGAKSPEESIQIIRSFSELGVTRFIATPHIMHNYYDNTPDTINNSLEKLQGKLLENNMKNISIEAAAEHMIDNNFEIILQEGAEMSMRKDYLLVEMSYLQPPLNFDQAITEVINKRYFPILAHPERYNFILLNSRKYADYKKKGIHFQLNLLSLGDYYDQEVQRKAKKLLDDDFIEFVASDVHNLKHMKALKKITLSPKTLNQIIRLINNTIETFY